MIRGLVVTLAAAACVGCSGEVPAASPAAGAAAPSAAVRPKLDEQPAEDVPFFDGLGAHGRKVTTSSPEAQRYFDQGLAFLYAFNHDEAMKSFRKAAAIDPKCAMAHWGMALSNGPHINFPMVTDDQAKAASAAVALARANAAGATAIERSLIDAAAKRYVSPQPADRKPLDEAYAGAMREIYKAHSDDADVGALFAEALMDLRPWDFWTADGKPQPGTDEILSTLQAVIARAPKHPMANHLYIHAVEASPEPSRGDVAADVLRDLEPGLGHMVHMPSHIDVRRGRWLKAIASNALAIESDRRYRERRPKQGFYAIYMAHNRHMLTFAAMMTGQSELAVRTIRDMVAAMPEDWRRENAPFADGFVGMPFEVLMRFGRWDDILAEPDPAEYLPFARALRLYARGVAYAAKGDAKKAREEQQAFVAAKGKLPQDYQFGNNSAAGLLEVAHNVLEGEILLKEGKQDAALEALRGAVAGEDRLKYDEPPDWIQPVRHPLGAALLKAKKTKAAEQVFREDLAKLPGNVWSLVGLARSLRLQKRDKDAADADKQLAEASSKADLPLSSSCLCLPGI